MKEVVMKFRLPMPLKGNLKALALFAKKTYGTVYIATEDVSEEGWMVWWREVPDPAPQAELPLNPCE